MGSAAERLTQNKPAQRLGDLASSAAFKAASSDWAAARMMAAPVSLRSRAAQAATAGTHEELLLEAGRSLRERALCCLSD